MAITEDPASAFNDPADDTVKLVAYTIVSLRRGHERIMEGGEGSVVVTANMNREALASWLLAKYLQEEVHAHGDGRKQSRSALIPGDELKFLRVHYLIVFRWPREALEFEETQVARLRSIHDAIT